MNSVLKLLLIFFFISNCSFNSNSKFWTKEANTKNEKINLNEEFLFQKKETLQKEFNPKLKIQLEFNNIFNIPLPAGTTSEEYLNAYEFVLKKLKEFKPEFILLSAGFDAHKNDPLAQFQLESKDFYTITKKTLELSKLFCDGKVVSILEGGYDLKALQESTEMHVNALLEFN